MSRIRRGLAVAGLTIAVAAGATAPAWATFADSTAVGSTVETITVTAPSSMTITDHCQGWWYAATIDWPASTTPRGVTGYRIMFHLNTGESMVVAETDASTLSVAVKMDRDYLNYQPQFSILTLTSYGWTAETPRSAVLTC